MVDNNNKDVFEYLMKKLPNEDIFKDIIGLDEVKKQINSALSIGRNIILVGPPGCGKTTFAKCVASALPEGASFVRVQGSPDLTAEDLLGDIDPIKALEYGPLSKESFIPGKIFKADNGVLFFDEVNRCPQKIQNSLLQVLQEKYSTIGGYDVDFPANFVFIGTMNPEDSSTEKLSPVFLDRFDLIYVGYPEKIDQEIKIVEDNGKSFVGFPGQLLHNTVQFVRSLRESENLSRHPSVRASIGLYERAQSNAYIEGKDSVNGKNIYDAVMSVLAHRIELKPSIKYIKTAEDFIKEEFDKFASKKDMDIKEESGSG
ncbi:MAG: AAA family ATPase [Nanobdellota archaeon]